MPDYPNLKGVVLCGGKGTRLRPLTYYFQKVMIPIGHLQKPLLEYIIRLMAKNGIKEIMLLVSYKAEQIMNYFGDGSRFGVKIDYIKDKPGVQGTASALSNDDLKNKISNEDRILLYYGDILTDIDISSMYKEHMAKDAIATLAVSKKYQIRVGIAKIENDRVTGLQEKPTLDLPVTIGVLIINGEVLGSIDSLKEKKEDLDVMSDLIPHLIGEGNNVQAYSHDSFWYDVGSTERYEKLDYDQVEKYLDKIIS
ncbi:MAG: nucleotidyltransferase family protein [Candidatus Bathyarchaeota archaeon]|nr:nucleotidyltransferase family protein [Candidatus Bathyarchaeota archaeon]